MIRNTVFTRFTSRVFPMTRRSYIKTPDTVFQTLNLSTQKLQKVAPIPSPFSYLPFTATWDRPSPVCIRVQQKPLLTSSKVHHYVGGLPALMQASQKLETLPPNGLEKVVYIQDDQIPKTLQSGHQGHVHPSEWAAQDCKTSNLFKSLAQTLGLREQDSPKDLIDYSYLHFHINPQRLLANPLRHLHVYASFFKQRLIHDLTSFKGVSEEDRWLCNSVQASLNYHETLSARIQKEIGLPTFKRGFRIYWSSNLEGIQKKQTDWNNLSIKTSFMNESEKMRYTLLKKEAPLYVLKVLGDGKFYPETPKRITEYLQRNYPNFKVIQGQVTDITVDSSNLPFSIHIKDGEKKAEHPTYSVFGSLGHNRVFLAGSSAPLWNEIPVSGISSFWYCTLNRQEIMKRLGCSFLENEEIHQYVDELVASANLSNLHVTNCGCTIEGDEVKILVRASQGAHFDSLVAHKNDLLHMRNNLEAYFIGCWELLAVGTCTRKTWVTNVPEIHKLSKRLMFLHGLSGIGYSFSAASLKSFETRSQ